MIEIVLLGRPVAKGRPRFSRETGRAYTPAQTIKYETELKLAAEGVMGDRPPLDGPLRLEMTVVVPIPRSWSQKKQAAARSGELRPTSKPDWDNFGKVVDAGNLVVWIDDSQIVDGRVSKHYGDKPCMKIRVTPLHEADATPDSPHNHEGVFA
jgi:Holliday junction resolvase RusA-like endonuclease